MRLRELLREVGCVTVIGDGDPEIRAIALDSRQVEPGDLFAALRGSGDDGMRHIGEAVDRGAAALLTPAIPTHPQAVPVVVAGDAPRAVGEAAAAFFGHPSRSLELVGVTGTNGKTTTAYLMRHLLNSAGVRCGMLGTIEYDLGGKVEPSPLTTPDAVSFSRCLAAIRDNGCGAAAVEVSSHALVQRRVWPHRFARAIFTNLTRDHLDYHGDMASYAKAKSILFANLDENAAAVVNLDDPAADYMLAATGTRAFGYTLSEDGEASESVLKATIVRSELMGQTFRIEGMGLEGDVETTLVGRHNVQNCLGALIAALSLGIGLETVGDALKTFPGVPGRLERLETPSGALVFVDYAHTDDALRSVLSILRPLTAGRLLTVFGCGGDRDRGKRPLMAKAAEAGSDLVAMTSDNPRTEDPERIFADITAGFSDPSRVRRLPDRSEAVAWAVREARQGDVVLVAGKGHENYQILGREKIHLDDRELVRAAF